VATESAISVVAISGTSRLIADQRERFGDGASRR
jgi:hypothetical protein